MSYFQIDLENIQRV